MNGYIILNELHNYLHIIPSHGYPAKPKRHSQYDRCKKLFCKTFNVINKN